MPIKHSFSVLFSNFKLVAKLFIFILIIMLVAGAILIGILDPVFSDFFRKIQEEFPISGDHFIQHPIRSIQELTRRFFDFLSMNSSMIATKFLYFWLLVVGSRFLITLPLMPVTKILHGKMTSGFDMGLANATIATLPQNLLFSFLTALVIGTVDLFLLIGLGYISASLFKLMRILALPISMLLIFTVMVIRMSLLCQWLPHICSQQSRNIFIAFKNSLKPTFEKFGKNFLCMFVLTVVAFAVIATTLIPTMGFFPILMVPTFMVLYVSLSLTLNFSYYQQKYFIDNGMTVINPVRKY